MSSNDVGPGSSARRSHNPMFAAMAVLLGSFIATADARLLLTGLPDLRGAFLLGFDEGAWLNTAATAPQIFVAPAVAWLATVYGIRRLFVVPCLLFAALSFAIPFVRNFQTLIAMHVMHGLLLGTFVPATLMIIVRNLPTKWWLPAIAIYAFRVGFMLNCGVSVVGYCIDELGWEWLYWQNVLLAPLMGALVWLGTPSEPVNREMLGSADWGGMALFGAGLALLYCGLDQGNRLDWFESGTILALFVGGGVLMLAFLVNEVLVENPWASSAVLASRNFGLGLLAIVCFSLSSVSNVSLVPNFLASIAQLRPEQFGWLLFVWAAVPAMVMLPISIWLLRAIDPRYVVICGFSAFALSSYLATFATHEWSTADFVPTVLLQGIGYSLTVLSIVMIVLSNVNFAKATMFAAYIQAFRLGGAEIGGALIATWLRIREQTHSNLLGQHVAYGNAQVAQALESIAGGIAGREQSSAAARSIGLLAGVVQREASVLSFIDGFWLTFWISIFAILVIAFVTKAPAGPFSAAARSG